MSKLTLSLKMEVGEVIDLTEFLVEIEWEIAMGVGNYNSLLPLFISLCGREPEIGLASIQRENVK